MALDLTPFDKIVVGASIRYGKHAAQVHRFVEANQAILEQKPSAFFSVNLVARKPQKHAVGDNPYCRSP